MKRYFHIRGLLWAGGVILILILITCSKNQFALKDFHFSGCKNDKSALTDSLWNPKESVEVKSKHGYFLISHNNVYFNCCPGRLYANADIRDTVITIDEEEKEHACNCICPYDLSYKVGYLPKGTYTLILQMGNLERARFTVDYTREVDTVYYIK